MSLADHVPECRRIPIEMPDVRFERYSDSATTALHAAAVEARESGGDNWRDTEVVISRDRSGEMRTHVMLGLLGVEDAVDLAYALKSLGERMIRRIADGH